jgi:predicted transcriptional regulator
MAQRSNTLDITIVEEEGAFNTFFKRWIGEKENYSFEGIAVLRQLLSNERARLMNVIKNKKPRSLYELARILGRDFKSVKEDIKLLERLGLVNMVAEKTGNRKRLRPILAIDTLYINLKI